MISTHSGSLTARRPLRLWPGIATVVIQWSALLLLPVAAPALGAYGIMAGVVGGLIVAIWWILFSRALLSERIGAILVVIAGVAATYRVADPSIAGGMMGLMPVIYAFPVFSLTLVVSVAASRRLSDRARRAAIAIGILAGCGALAIVRTEGVLGSGRSQFAWRWTPTPEERLLTQAGREPLDAEARADVTLPSAVAAPAPVQETPAKQPDSVSNVVAPAPPPVKTVAQWPGFRGADRNGIVTGTHIETDWSRVPPVRIWHRPIGPGWSSFAVSGDLLYTQEQRGEEEVVACYRVTTGAAVWQHRDRVRFWESNGGAGPRATPTLGDGRVYAFGATGILNALDAGSGAVVWSRNVSADADVKAPYWGFSSSPLVMDGEVIVAASGKLVAYEAATGRPRWSGAARGESYSSPQRRTIGGVAQVLLLTDKGVASVAPADGAVLWERPDPGVAIVQPAFVGDGDVLIAMGNATGGNGVRRISVSQANGTWTLSERWSSVGLKPYFNDFVVHKNHAYGFDGNILSCINLEDGRRMWKGGRYGNGQLVLLPDQDVLLVVSEEGELALVGATPDGFRELGRVPGIEGKTWNHPVVTGDVLLVRNGEEMAAFRLSSPIR